ncbi:MAG: hypothetical protein JXN64_08360 [Spirochaetes bacterium]|nr:hypothetical protein [Spirochaetota bacterium]
MRKFIIVSIICCILRGGSFFTCGLVYAASGPDIGLYDNSPVALRLPDVLELNRIRNDKAYQYEKEMVPGNAIADIIASWISWLGKNFFSHIFSKKAEPFRRFFPYAVIAASAVIVILALRRGGFFGLFSRKGYRAGDVQYDSEGDIHDIDFNFMIKKFMDAGDYRTALRYRFLKTLKQLSVKGLIVWRKEKTNRDYINEIVPEKRSSFNDLVNIFEYVWYGSFAVDKKFLELMNGRFRSFDLSMGDFVE